MSDIQREHILTYWLKAPKGSHKTFSIWFRKKDLKTQKTIEHGKYTDERTEILNVMLKSGKKKFESVKKEFNKIVKELQEQEEKLRGKIPILGENEVVFDEFWQRRYAHKRNIDLESAKNETLRAIQAVGEVPLISARVHEIQNAVDKHCDGDRDKQRRTISRLKTILRVIGRIDVAEKLDKDRKIHRNPTHITYRDLADLVNHIRLSGAEKIAGVSLETYISLIQFLFWSGLRIGEALAVQEFDYNPKPRVLDVKWQITQKGKKKLPKGEKQRKGHIPLQGSQFFYEWVNAVDRHQLKRHEGTKKLKEFCKAIFKDPTKHVSFHGLRHSYACVMLRHFDITIEAVADYIGDNILVAKENYAGFVPDELAFERAAKKTEVILK